MTALKDFERLEAIGLWRPDKEAQRREVIVSLGEATLTISDTAGRALTHWSLAAVVRAGRGTPALFHPEGDPDEVLELPEDESDMIYGIDRLIAAIERRRPHPGKLRWGVSAMIGLAVTGLAVFWLPDALVSYTVTVVPPVKRAEIGAALLDEVTRLTGQPCAAQHAQAPLQQFASRLLGEARSNALVVVPQGVRDSAHLPGGLILLNRSVLEDHEDPDVPAGYVIAESLRAKTRDPLDALLQHAGLWPALRLLTTGNLPAPAVAGYAEAVLVAPSRALEDNALLDAFAAADVRSTPYAYAVDITGESVLALIEADPRARDGSRTVLEDSAWLRLQTICEP